MRASIQQAERNWHDKLYASRGPRDLVVPESIRNRYLSPKRTPRFSLEFLFSRIGDVRNKRVLVFGCGDNNATVLLALKGAEVWAFDLSEEAVRIQEQMALANEVRNQIRLFVGAAEEFPFGESSFDLIVGSAILHHIPDHLAQLPSQLVHALKRNGRAIFVEPLILSPALGRLLAWFPGHQKISPGERQLTCDDLSHFTKCFHLSPRYFCFLARLDRFILNGPLEVAPFWKRFMIHAIHLADRAILKIPFLKRLAGVAVMELSPIQL